MTDYLGELRETARQVIADTGTPACEENTWPRIVELGWLLTCVPQEWEGLGLGIEGACTLHTQLGRGLAGAPFLPAMLALEAVCHSDFDCDGARCPASASDVRCPVHRSSDRACTHACA